MVDLFICFFFHLNKVSKSRIHFRQETNCDVIWFSQNFYFYRVLEKKKSTNVNVFGRLGKLRPTDGKRWRAVFQRSVSGKGLLSLEVTVYDLWFEVEKEALWFGDWPPRPHWRALHYNIYIQFSFDFRACFSRFLCARFRTFLPDLYIGETFIIYNCIYFGKEKKKLSQQRMWHFDWRLEID